tara:strand:- start:12626 stop:13189 length:564 start_codon:yes stop_codon:yes gene_type:complete
MEALVDKCEMLERIITIKDQEIKRLFELLTIQKSGNQKQSILPPQITCDFLQTIERNILKLNDTDIRRHISAPSPAYKSITTLLQKLFVSDNKLCIINHQNYITYKTFDDLKKVYYVEIFDIILKKLYDRCVIACKNIHENINNEHDNNISDYCHDNIMMLFSDNEKKTKLQKDLLKVIKPMMLVHK